MFIEFATILFLFYVFVFLAMRHVGSYLSDHGLNLCPQHWKVKS